MKKIKNGSITAPSGFLASGLYAGIKPKSRKLDCSLIFSKIPAVSAGVFTINKAKAWPLLYDESVINQPTHQAILANSGNANCFNGESGRKTVQMSVKSVAKHLKINPKSVLVASTGIIGKPFPIEKLKAAIPMLVEQLSVDGANNAARGILTTDTCPKEIAVEFRIEGTPVRLGAIAKGSGMVYPHMTLPGERHATMLCYFTSDCSISKPMLKLALSNAVKKSFNNIVIDNDMSTNDMVIVLANGLAKNNPIVRPGKSFNVFQKALTSCCMRLARELVQDGEGVQHVCEIKVTGAKTQEEARSAAKQIATSMLVKTMLAGEDPNWGRVVAAVGASGVEFSKNLDISFDGLYILKNGKHLAKNRAKLRKVLHKKMIVLQVNLKKGRFEETYLTTDLTKFYVWINSTYSS